MTYTKRVRVEGEFEAVVDRTIDALTDEGFGVVSDLDMQGTVEEKIGEEMERYRILGACDPSVAYEGIGAEPDLGALLPCNVVVRENEAGEVVVSAVDPPTLVGLTDNDTLVESAKDVETRFDRVLETVSE